MRSLVILILLVGPLAARADTVPRPSAGVSPTYLTRAGDPRLLCDSAVAEDCFRMLAPQLTRDMIERDDEACLSATTKSPDCAPRD
ncbi:MAG TPA: hypothetical protein VFW22_14290 [Pseudolabrys sp.]|nr:hypothetical protein [Pseudolabrys sp.]